MKILLVSDEECPALWDYYVPGRLDGYDLIISCGDLNAKYLSFLVTMAKCPVLYVPGNHDTHYESNPPEGCDNIDGQIVEFNGLRIMGLGGCRKYHSGPYQYTDFQMRRRIWKLHLPLMRTRGVDLVVTHAPVAGFGDAPDYAHRGFDALLDLIDKYHPKYLAHGHVHMNYDHTNVRLRECHGTTLINATERYVLEIPDPPCKESQRGQVIWRTHRKRSNDLEDMRTLQNPTGF